MWQLLRARRGKKAAVAFIAPLVAASRHGALREIPERAWLTPYMVGFMGMLISLVAQRAASGLNSDVLGIVQVEAWRSITGDKQHPIGEDICLLSTDGNHEFEDGCSSARRFLAALDEAGVHMYPDVLSHHGEAHGAGFDHSTAQTLWADYFEAHIDSSSEPQG
ncbi:MAG: hypothetical protein MPJ78_11960 [Hyphomicrobiaceae bacterium]|nr:hypothetical protein [Hyphomicrobiaceae bacterium]